MILGGIWDIRPVKVPNDIVPPVETTIVQCCIIQRQSQGWTGVILPARRQVFDEGNHCRVSGGNPAVEGEHREISQVGNGGGKLSAEVIVMQSQPLEVRQVSQFEWNGTA